MVGRQCWETSVESRWIGRERVVVGDEINCGEFSVNDNYRLQIYQKDFQRPAICVQWDPENPLCQVLGKYQLRLDSQPGVLPRYNYVPIHPGFGNSCPAQAPDYLAPIDC